MRGPIMAARMEEEVEMRHIRNLAAGAAFMALVVPALASAQVGLGDGAYDRKEMEHIGQRVGELLAGAMSAGQAAIQGAKRGWYDNGGAAYYDPDLDRADADADDYGYGNAGRAVRQCVDAARYSADADGRARISDINDIDSIQGGYRVRGSLAVEDGYRSNNGRFDCRVRYGRIDRLRITGLG